MQGSSNINGHKKTSEEDKVANNAVEEEVLYEYFFFLVLFLDLQGFKLITLISLLNNPHAWRAMGMAK